LFAYPGSGSDHCSIPDPGGKKAPDPGSATLVVNPFFLLYTNYLVARYRYLVPIPEPVPVEEVCDTKLYFCFIQYRYLLLLVYLKIWNVFYSLRDALLSSFCFEWMPVHYLYCLLAGFWCLVTSLMRRMIWLSISRYKIPNNSYLTLSDRENFSSPIIGFYKQSWVQIRWNQIIIFFRYWSI
jgi:hypothetical protein